MILNRSQSQAALFHWFLSGWNLPSSIPSQFYNYSRQPGVAHLLISRYLGSEYLDWNLAEDCIQSTTTDMNILGPNRGVSPTLLTLPLKILDCVCLLYQMFSLTSHSFNPWNAQYIDWS